MCSDHIHTGLSVFDVRLKTLWILGFPQHFRPDFEVPGSNPAGGRLQLMTVWCLIAQSFSLSPVRSRYDINRVKRKVKHQVTFFHHYFIPLLLHKKQCRYDINRVKRKVKHQVTFFHHYFIPLLLHKKQCRTLLTAMH